MKRYKLPTRQQCFRIIKEYHVPGHIIRHSLAVAKLAVFLAEKLKEKGLAVDVELVESACLLHDVVRVCDFKELDYSRFEGAVTEKDKAKWEQIRAKYKGVHHEDAAYDILKDDYPALALTIRKHRYSAMLNEETRPKTLEEKLLYYADMRVMHDEIVPLKTRLEDGHKRNDFLHGTAAQAEANTSRLDPLIYQLEKEIFAKAGLGPVEITGEFINSYPKNS